MRISIFISISVSIGAADAAAADVEGFCQFDFDLVLSLYP